MLSLSQSLFEDWGALSSGQKNEGNELLYC